MTALRLVVLVAVYVAAGKLGLSLAFVNESASAVWPPTGIAIATLMILGLRCWPVIFIGAFLVNVTTSGALVASLAIATGNTLEGATGAWLAGRFARGRAAFERAADVLRFTVLGAVAATTISATVGTATLTAAGLAHSSEAASIWITWWLGDAVGAVLVAPLIVLWSRPVDSPWTTGGRLEAVLGALLLVGISYIVFGPSAAGLRNYPLEFLAVPVLLWAALRYGARETATATAMLSVVAIWGTLHGYGPFRRDSQNESLLLLQAFTGVISIVLLAVAAEVAARRDTERRVRLLNDTLEARVRERTDDLAKMHAHLNEAQQVAHVGSWEWDVVANSLWWSDELYRIYAIDREAATSYEDFLAHVYPEDRERIDAAVRQALDDRRPFSFEHRIVRPDGTVRVLHADGRVVTDASGAPVRMVGTGHDITERKQAEEARAQLIHEQAARRDAEEANRAKDHFLATLSHELRTPLNAALGWAHMLRQTPLDGPGRTRAVDAINRNLLVQARLVSDIMDVSRMTMDAMRLEKEVVSVVPVVEAAIETIRDAAAARLISVHLRVNVASVEVRGDARRLQQVIWNLLANAVKFARDGGCVDVSIAQIGPTVEIVVEDDGPGIEPEFLPYVFEQFRQADSSLTREHGGLGLGLAIARHIVEMHGGTIAAANRQGRGAVFTVWLPAAAAAAAVGA